MKASFIATPGADPIPCEIIREREDGVYVCRQVGRQLAGVWAARSHQLYPPVEVDAEDFGFWVRRNLQVMGAI